jgi:hypothetical protein
LESAAGRAYLATGYHPWYAHLLNATVVDWDHWARGDGTVKLRLTESGQMMLGGSAQTFDIYYNQGPLLARADTPQLPPYDELGVFESEIAQKDAPHGVMIGTSAVARAAFGKGRVFVFSPHPEYTKGLEHYVRRAVTWAAGERAGVK